MVKIFDVKGESLFPFYSIALLVVMLIAMSMTPGSASPIVATPSPGNGPFADGRIGKNFLGQVSAINVNQFIMVGDDSGPLGSTEIVYRGFLGFQIPTIPAGSVIQSVVLRLSLRQGTSSVGNVLVDLVDFGASLDAADYDAPALTANIGIFSAIGPINQYQELDVTVAAAAAVSQGTVQFRIRAALEQSQLGQNIASFNDIENSSGTGQVPQLVITLGSPNQPPVITADNASITIDEAQTTNNTGTVNDPDGDTVTLSASIGTVTNNGNDTWFWSFITSDGPAQSQSVIISADDGNGGTAQTSFALTVNNIAPLVDAITVPVNPIDISNQPVSVSATFSDPAGINDQPYTCTIDFGDGSGQQSGTVAGMTCIGSHTYASAGVYVVTVTVTDKDNDSGSASATSFIVIYDPSAGYVTGGGWINSPLGAYVADPSLTGKANFGFVSKYQKGKSTPDGNTTFHFNAANFKFKSTSYEWLVIAGPKAQYKGEGAVNNNGTYGFLLFATDGQINGGGGVDKFRIKIWDKNNGDAVVYDNQMGDPENGDATDAIEGGSITIHSGSASKASAANSEEEVAFVPTEYALEQNYPNPFNPSTQITFALPEAGEVQLAIYNTSGQLVRMLVIGQKSAGTHKVMWDANDNNGTRVASGVYLYMLKAGNFTAQRKLVLMK